MDNNTTPVLSLKNIGKAFGENLVLADISVDIMPGEIHAICGENGAGKSTLMNILFGMPVIQSTGGYQGEISVCGKPVKITNPKQAIENGIGMVHQEFMLIPGFRVDENIKLNREPLKDNLVSRLLGTKLKNVDFNRVSQESAKTLAKLGVSLDESVMIDSLPVGYMQFTEIAREIDKENVKLLILDEPTAVLTESEAEVVLKIVRHLSDMGIAVILITHRINDIMQVGDRLTILRDGRNVRTMNVSDTTPGEIAELMVGREVDMGAVERRDTSGFTNVAVSVRDLKVEMPGEVVKGIDLDVYEGEILGIGGLAGQGKVGIANGIMGLYPTEGEIKVFGENLKLNNPADAISKKIAFVSEDRRRTGFAPDLSIAQNIAAPTMHNHGRFFKNYGFFKQVDDKAITEVANGYIKEFQIKCTGPNQNVGTLSGGNQQKVCVASALLLQPKVLLVSEPTRGIDVGAKSMVLNTIRRINREDGVTIIMTSSELAELRQICDRIAIVAEGKISDIVSPDASSEEIGLAMSGEGDLA